MKYPFFLLAALFAASAAEAAGSTQPPQTAPAPVDAAYLQGRWCETDGSGWMSAVAATRQINLPDGNSGQRKIASFSLAEGVLTITGPTGARVTAMLRRIDAESMYYTVGSRTWVVRRC